MTAAGGVPTGNRYDKQGTRNPVARRLLARFDAVLDGLLAQAAPRSVLDVGCGEGVPAERWARRPEVERVVGVDLDDPALRAAWATRTAAGLSFAVADAAALPFADRSFDVVAAVEALEHVPDPDAALAEMARCTRGHLLVSVPREPLWRALNLARGAYLRDWGNTPGHVQHFSARTLRACLARHGDVVALHAPAPWLVALVRVR